jgi:hypothetical protein
MQGDEFGTETTKEDLHLGYNYIYKVVVEYQNVNVLNLHRIDVARKYHTHLQREIEKEEEREKEWKNSH